MSITGMSLPGRGSRATPAQIARTKRRALIVQRSYALAAQKVAAEDVNNDDTKEDDRG